MASKSENIQNARNHRDTKVAAKMSKIELQKEWTTQATVEQKLARAESKQKKGLNCTKEIEKYKARLKKA